MNEKNLLEIKRCGNCDDCYYHEQLNIYYCKKYNGTVELNDECIEVVLDEM